MSTVETVTFRGIGSEAAREATGRSWEEWLAELDAAGAEEWDHRTIAAHLEREHPGVGSWWHQAIAVTFERARGKRAVGQDAKGDFSVGVQRSMPLSRREAWDLLTSRPDLWLGEGATLEIAKGARYEAPDASGEVRIVRPGDRLKVTWQPDGWAAPAGVQFTLLGRPTGKTAVHVHVDKLPDGEARDAMRSHWRAALERLGAAAAG